MIVNILLTILFSIFSTAILSYISMAIMIGPWIDSVIVILSSLCLSILATRSSIGEKIKSVSLITAGSSLGGILATGCGFAFPTLYFLNKELFNQWLSSPVYFISILAAISFSAGALGLLIAGIFEHQLITVDKLPFPVGEVSFKLASIQESAQKAYQLFAGFLVSCFYSFAAKMYYPTSNFFSISKSFSLKNFTFPALNIPINELPLLISIGFIAGNIILGPLTVGIISKIFLLNPLHSYYFSRLSYNDFSFAFISGMVTYGAFMSLTELPKFFSKIIARIRKPGDGDTSFKSLIKINAIELVVVMGLAISLLTWFKFSPSFQFYLILFTALCTYQLLIIGGELGLAPVARFATFVMMPAIFIFNPSDVQLTLISTFVEVCGGVAVDVLFGRKLGHLAQIQSQKIKTYQWLGLAVSAITVGIVFWVLITKLGLGSSQLIAQRGQTRALTIQFQSFDFYSMVVGALFGAILKDFKINPIMVLGGILMPTEWALSLVAGGALSYLTKNKESLELFWSGVFAANSMIMIIKALF